MIERFVELALGCVHREFPNQVQHMMRTEADCGCRPSALTPAFYGCYDWHSAVHSHWVLARAVARQEAHWEAALAALDVSLTEVRLAREVDYLRTRPAFERPYGLAWLATLHAQLLADDRTTAHGARLTPLVDVAAGHLAAWLPKLSHPVRTGVHNQTAFALGLLLDWARAVGRDADAALYEERARSFFAADRGYAPHLEPSGEDFLSPSLGPADLLARVLDADELAAWLERALPELGRGPTLRPVTVTDPTDGRLAHLDGLNLSRAWMLSRIARALPDGDRRVEGIAALGEVHAELGLAAVSATHYEGAHWLGTFATYLLEGPAAG